MAIRNVLIYLMLDTFIQKLFGDDAYTFHYLKNFNEPLQYLGIQI